MEISTLHEESDGVPQNDNILNVLQSRSRFGHLLPHYLQEKDVSKRSVNAVFNVDLMFNLNIALPIKIGFSSKYICFLF